MIYKPVISGGGWVRVIFFRINKRVHEHANYSGGDFHGLVRNDPEDVFRARGECV